MTEIAGLLAGTNRNYDTQLTALAKALLSSSCVVRWVGGWLAVSATEVASGEAFILCTRTNGDKVMVHYKNSASVSIAGTGTKKVFVKVDQAKLDDGSSNSLDGSGIASIQTDTTYPSSNYVALASIASSVITDARVYVDPALYTTGGALTGPLLQAKSANIASATTTDLWTMTGDSGHITGTTTIVWFGTVQAWVQKKLTFDGILTLTYNATSMILPKAGANITTAVGDTAVFVSEGSGNWRCVSYTRADGTALVSTSAPSASTSTPGIAELATDAEALGWTDTSRIVVPSSLALATTIPEQTIPIKISTSVGFATNLQTWGNIDGSLMFVVTYNSTAQIEISRLMRDTKTWQYLLTHQTTLNGSSFGGKGHCAVAGNYLYVAINDSGTAILRRYDVADLANVTTMTISGTAIGTQIFAMFSEWTNLYIFKNGTTNVFRKYTISGTTATYDSDITYTSSIASEGGACCDGTSVWIVESNNGAMTFRKYALAGGSATSSTSRIIFWSGAYPNWGVFWLSMGWKPWTINASLWLTIESNSAVVSSAVKLVAISV